MKWSNLPEVTIKKNEPAKYEGVLVPELNYRNYRSLEEIQPELDKVIHNDGLPLCDEGSSWTSPILWGVIGIVLGGIAVGVMK